MTTVELAYICNDLVNAHLYNIVDDKAYYNGEFIGTVSTKNELVNDTIIISHYFKPIKIVEYITVNITIQKPE